MVTNSVTQRAHYSFVNHKDKNTTFLLNSNTCLLLTILLSIFISIVTHATPPPPITTTTIISEHIIAPFTAKYNILHKSDPVGSASRQLIYLKNGLARYSYHTELEWLIFSDQRSETSVVRMSADKITPTHYLYTRKGTGKDKYYEWQYDAKNNQALNLKNNPERKKIDVDFSLPLQDKFSYHLQHRLNLIYEEKNISSSKDKEITSHTYPVITTSGYVKDYTYVYDGTEELMLPYGLVKAVRYKREVKEKITYAWFAPELNYLLVKLYQVKDGNGQFEAQLTTLTDDYF